jgi:hypothetical protein
MFVGYIMEGWIIWQKIEKNESLLKKNVMEV